MAEVSFLPHAEYKEKRPLLVDNSSYCLEFAKSRSCFQLTGWSAFGVSLKNKSVFISIHVHVFATILNSEISRCHLANEFIVFWRCRCRRQLVVKLVIIGCECWDSDNTLSNIALANKPPLQGCERFQNMPLKRKRKLLASLLVVQLLGGENDVMKRWKARVRAKKSMMYNTTPTQLSLQDTSTFKGDNENDSGSGGAI